MEHIHEENLTGQVPAVKALDRNALWLWLGFGAMCVGMFMAILDIQVVASSLTAIADALAIPKDRLGWIQTSYLMAEVIAIPLTGLMTRAFSLRWMFAAATFGFTLASLGCALSGSIESLIAFRVLQGFCGGMLIPAVFTSVFVMMPERYRLRATTIAGVFALLAPTLGPMVGGYLTETHSWHWIFLINIVPGLAVTAIVAFLVRVGAPARGHLKQLDIAGLLLFTVFLALLELLLNEGPRLHWRGGYIIAGISICLVSGALGLLRCCSAACPFVHLKRFRNLAFSIGCAFSFVLGVGLYGSIYILSLFLGMVRGHSPLAIGEILTVTGMAQLATSPLAAWLETRMAPKILTGLGFGLFGAGMLANGFAVPQTDFAGLFWPQLMRGAAMMLCLLPATRLALDIWPAEDVADASGLFNLLRNLGGAIGIALIATLVEERTPQHVSALIARLQAGDPAAAGFVGLPTAMFHNHAMGPVDDLTKAMIAPLIQRAALTLAFNEAWIVIAALFGLSLLLLPLLKQVHMKRSALGPGT